MGDINFRAITWHGLLWQQKGNYICNQRQEWKKLNFFTPYVLNHKCNTIFHSRNYLDLVSLTKRNIAMMSKPKKTCWVKKAGGKLKRKKANYHHQSFYTASHFTSYIFSCVVYRCAFFVDELCCEGYHQIRHLYIKEQHINNPHNIYYFVYRILKITNKYHTNIP